MISKAQPQSVYRRLCALYYSPPPLQWRVIPPNPLPPPIGSYSRTRGRSRDLRSPPSRKTSVLDSTVYLNTFRRLATHGEFSMIEEIVEHQKKFKDITRGKFVSRLIVICGRVGMFKQARKLFDELPGINCPRTVYSLNALLSACIDSEKW
ncbi:unnamed protein product [Linum tenue]|uniref:Pentatricopeptide repeat-containing protein n=1 Tax=Linum tenue TaxID=586396 RepID=A0AAV0PB10_9ROSI|nr:unnamed protein product [Linum tenue]